MQLDPVVLGTLGFFFMLILIFIRIPVAYAMIFVGFGGYWLVNGWTSVLNVMRETFYETLQNETFLAIPLFILMGYFAFHSGIIERLFGTAQKLVGDQPGGVAQATILGGAAFGATTGSGIAATATLAKIAYPQMLKSGVDKRLAYGVVASVGPLAVLIPPSIMLILFGVVTQQSIGKLLIAGIFPGLLTAIIYMGVVYLWVKKNPDIAKSLPKVSIKERLLSLKDVWAFLLMIFLVVAGLYTGIFTPSEAGAAGSFIVFVMMIFMRGFKWELIKDALLQTVNTTSMLFLLICGTGIFGYFMTISRVPTNLSDFLVNLTIAPTLILIGVIILYIVMGMFMDMVSGMLLTLPVIYPSIIALGFDPLWFGVTLVLLVELALVTPPFGLSLFILKGAVPDSDMLDIYKGIMPFIFASLFIIALFIAFPQLVTFVPNISGM